MDVFDSGTKVALAVMVNTVERDLHSTMIDPLVLAVVVPHVQSKKHKYVSK